MSAEMIIPKKEGNTLTDQIELSFAQQAIYLSAGMKKAAELGWNTIDALRFHPDMIYTIDSFQQLMVQMQTETDNPDLIAHCVQNIDWAEKLCPSTLISFVYDENEGALEPIIFASPPAKKMW